MTAWTCAALTTLSAVRAEMPIRLSGAGCVAVRPTEGRQWLEHFYLAPHCQGRGLGSTVLRTVLERTDAQGTTVGLNVLQGSAARRLYERHGFVVEAQDPIDVFMMRPPGAMASTAAKA
ncbi:GNAT family N-acetyltransferase [Streptomyces ferrugineus]|uniref:GNAT family N-acetyltransferase n=1 Tax=Streptomyces ferrugineus TaxID=1413221 RepID=A0A7M2SX80_9ACTN|nr:GNAT family N-acetyltransferase [Streptomyces ferrugineus]